jgi:hypothetical protein
MQRESEAVAAVISCLFLLRFRDNPAQGKSRGLRVHTGSSAHQRDGTRLLNFIAALTIKVDLSGPSQICNSAVADKSALPDRHIRCADSSFQRRDDRLLDWRRRKCRRRMLKTWASAGAFSPLTRNCNLAQY